MGVVMARHKDANWTLPEDTSVSYDEAQLAVLMDIRDELKRLNTVLQCPNFIAVPAKLDAIDRNTSRTEKNTRRRTRRRKA